jgi:F-type H+-transporting ATPase subunit b
MMNGLILLAQAGGGGPVQEIARTFGVDWTHLISQIISFGIVCALLYKFAYRRVLAMLEQRRQQIAESLANAEKIKAELARTEAQRQEVMTQANAQATKLIEEARAAAARVQEQETQKAIAAAEQIIAKAREAAEADHARMLTELKREVGRLVVQTTTTVTGKILTPEDQRRLAEETAKSISGSGNA